MLNDSNLSSKSFYDLRQILSYFQGYTELLFSIIGTD